MGEIVTLGTFKLQLTLLWGNVFVYFDHYTGRRRHMKARQPNTIVAKTNIGFDTIRTVLCTFGMEALVDGEMSFFAEEARLNY
jgi:hypothetical protein